MFEKVSMYHPDKIADRIAGAITDLAYRKASNPKVAAEVLIGHGQCFIIIESSEYFGKSEIEDIVHRIAGQNIEVILSGNRQDILLANNQANGLKCGDNGIFKGVSISMEEYFLSELAKAICTVYPTDGKYIIDGNRIIVCQSKAEKHELLELVRAFNQRYTVDANVDWKYVINPLGYWNGGTNVDSGATNRKLGSDMGRAVTGGGLWGKDFSKADLTANVYYHLQAQRHHSLEGSCAIGDDSVGGIPFDVMEKTAMEYVHKKGGFEKLAEWGLI